MTDKRIKEIPFNYEKWTQSYYVVSFYCDNCGKHFDYLLPKKVPQKGVIVECENCGCEGVLA